MRLLNLMKKIIEIFEQKGYYNSNSSGKYGKLDEGGSVKMAKIIDIADYFLSKESMTHKKLQKLCYYAEAWYLAKYKKPLTNSDYEAWVHGPVSRELFSMYKGRYSVPQSTLNDFPLEKCEREIIDLVYNVYGNDSGDVLESLTHSERPWIEARGNIPYWQPSNNIISKDIMRDYYATLSHN